MSDAWIFLSIGHAGGLKRWVTLSRLIEAADASNHAIPTIEELEVSVSKLTAAGLIETRGAEIRLTKAGSAAYRNAMTTQATQRMIALDREWKARDYPAAVATSWSLDADTFRRAYSDYAGLFGRILGRVEEPRGGGQGE